MKGNPMRRNYGIGSPMNQGKQSKQSKKTSETIPETTANPNIGENLAKHEIWTEDGVTMIKVEDGSSGPMSQYTRDVKDPETGKVETLSLLEIHKRGMKL